jgi:hypothetical protein
MVVVSAEEVRKNEPEVVLTDFSVLQAEIETNPASQRKLILSCKYFAEWQLWEMREMVEGLDPAQKPREKISPALV